MKVAISKNKWAFSLSLKAKLRYLHLKGLPFYVGVYSPEEDCYMPVDSSDLTFFLSSKDLWFSFFTDEALTEKYDFTNVPRNCPVLIQVLEELQEEANNSVFDYIQIVDIPDNIEWEIYSCDGREWVAEKHRTWGKD